MLSVHAFAYKNTPIHGYTTENPTTAPMKAQHANAKPSLFKTPEPAVVKKPAEDSSPLVEKTSNVHTEPSPVITTAVRKTSVVHTEPSPVTTAPVAIEPSVEEATSLTGTLPVVQQQSPTKQKRKRTDIEDSIANKQQKQHPEFKSPIVLLVEESFESGTTLDVCSLVRDQTRFFNELGEAIDKAKASITPSRDDFVSFGVGKYKIDILKHLGYSEKVFVYIINRVRMDDPELYKTTITEYLRRIQLSVREKGLINRAYMRHFRLLSSVLKEANDTQLMIDTLLVSLHCRNAKYHIIPCTFNLLCIWEEVFKDPQYSSGYSIQLLDAVCDEFHKNRQKYLRKLKIKKLFGLTNIVLQRALLKRWQWLQFRRL